MNVPFFELTHQYQSIKNEILTTVNQVLENQQFILGAYVESFEENIKNYCGAQYAIGVSSGTDALIVALMALDIGPGDEVITSPYTFVATITSIMRLGGKPVFVDISQSDFNIAAEKIKEKISKRTKAIIPVHLFGQMAQMDVINAIAAQYRLHVIEDAAQAIGSAFHGKKAGTWGDIGCFSFFPTKNLGAFGDGGMLVTNSESLYEKIKMIRVHGQKMKYCAEMIGGNFRLDALQAAILDVKFKYLDSWIQMRRRNAGRYNDLFRDLSIEKKIILPAEIENSFHTYNQYVIRIPVLRDRLRSYLKSSGIGSEIYYPLPAHLQPILSKQKDESGCMIESETAAMQALAIPIYPELTDEMQVEVSKAIHEFMATQPNAN